MLFLGQEQPQKMNLYIIEFVLAILYFKLWTLIDYSLILHGCWSGRMAGHPRYGIFP